MKRIAVTIFAVASALSACKGADALYCDESTPCTDPSRPFCDLNGEFSASDGVSRTCIADPSTAADGGVDIDGGDDPDAGMVDCESSDVCPAGQPICNGQECVSCTPGDTGDGQCAARDGNAPFCGSDGQCYECVESDDCSQATPYCEPVSNTCRTCQAHEECESGACHLDSGECVSQNNIVYVDNAGDNGATCGGAPGVNACESLAGDGAALSKVTASRRTIVFTQGTYPGRSLIQGFDIDIVGNGAILESSFQVGPVLDIRTDSAVRIYNLGVAEGLGFSGHGITCIESSLELFDVAVEDNSGAGILGEECLLTMKGSTSSSNGRQGLDLSQSLLEMRDTDVRSNGFQGLFLDDSVVEISRAEIDSNISGGIRLIDSSFLIENTMVVRNGNSVQNPSNFAGGIRVSSNSALSPQLFRFVTVADNNAPNAIDSPGIDCNTDSIVEIDSSIVVGNNTPGPSPQFFGTCSFTFSDVPGPPAGTGNIPTPPTFAAPQAGNYRLAAGSAGVDVANPGSTVGDDFEGDPRPAGAGRDMGADERP